MPDLILDWGLFGSNGTDLSGGGTVDTGGVNVTLGFTAEDEVGGKTFDPVSVLKLFGLGGQGGVDDTLTTTIDFSASDESFSDNVQNVSFRVHDLNLGQGGADYTDIVTVRAFDAAANPVEVALTPVGDLVTSGDTAIGNHVESASVTARTNLDTSTLVDITGPVSRIEIDYDNDGTASQSVWATDVHFSTIDADDELEGANQLHDMETVEGGTGNGFIFTAMTMTRSQQVRD